MHRNASLTVSRQRIGEESDLSRIAIVTGSLLLVAGCGSYPELDTPVGGLVRIDGVPSEGTAVFFIPSDKQKHAEGLIGQGFTDKDGKFALKNARGKDQFYRGEFRVTFTRYIDKKGNPIPIEVKPDDVGATQQLPPDYITPDTTPYTVQVNPQNHTFTFDIKTK